MSVAPATFTAHLDISESHQMKSDEIWWNLMAKSWILVWLWLSREIFSQATPAVGLGSDSASAPHGAAVPRSGGAEARDAEILMDIPMETEMTWDDLRWLWFLTISPFFSWNVSQRLHLLACCRTVDEQNDAGSKEALAEILYMAVQTHEKRIVYRSPRCKSWGICRSGSSGRRCTRF